MDIQEQREDTFAGQLAFEVAKNIDDISEIIAASKVGACGGKCNGYTEKELSGLCPVCLEALESESYKIFSASPMLKLLGNAMNSQD
ncbi:MAG: hypothetical protein ACLQF0_14570 [Dissulfurispiraceae bacterium]